MERDTGSIVRKPILFLIFVLFAFFAFGRATLCVQAEEEIQEGSDEKASSDLDPKADSTSLDQIPLEPPKMEIRLRLPEEREFKRVVSNRAFGVGERLEFSVGYGVIKAGTAVMEIPDIAKLDGRRCYHIVSTARSNKFFSVFFRVDDRVESFMDIYGLYSLRYDKHLREGKFRTDVSMVFDQANNLAIYDAGKDTFEVAEYVQDVLSAFYFVRTQELTVGRSIFVDNHTDRKNYPLEVKVLRKERIKVEAGEFDCLVVEPILQTGGIFEQKGSLTVWLTDDEVKMPVLMKSKVVIGSISTELINYRLGEVGKI
ncbi:MAG: DUF3108 domain-containing protein [Candidatus Zixiibacteriota bacterium]